MTGERLETAVSVLILNTEVLCCELSFVFLPFLCRHSLGKTYNIVLGSGQVVVGMDMGLQDMCVGERRRVVIPPHLGYGEEGVGK